MIGASRLFTSTGNCSNCVAQLADLQRLVSGNGVRKRVAAWVSTESRTPPLARAATPCCGAICLAWAGVSATELNRSTTNEGAIVKRIRGATLAGLVGMAALMAGTADAGYV